MMRFIYFFSLLLLPIFSFSAAQFAKTPLPKWINQIAYPSDSILKDSGSFQYLLLDYQINLIRKARFIHHVIQVFNSEGIQSMSDIDISFDPSYQKLQIHKIQVIRNGKIINKINTNIQIIQRETSMERSIYDGSLSAVINLSDVRDDDIIEYSYSLIGFNPIHKGHYASLYSLQYGLAVNHIYNRIVAKKSTNLFFKSLNAASDPEVLTKHNKTDYIWDIEALDYIIYDNNIPIWYEPHRQVAITTFNNWAEVVEWGLPLYDYPPLNIKGINDQLKQKDTKEEKILFLIRFVQDEVRYLGFESGIGAYKPHPPKIVYNQRYGDCKDKSLLLISLLRSIGVSAHPLWVNTELLQEVNMLLPSYNIFDHSVVCFEWEGKQYFIDPTISMQGGDLDHIYFPDYRTGLLIKPGEKALIDIPKPEVASYHIYENIIVDSIGGSAYYTVRTEYTGRKSDYARADFNSSSKDVIQKDYLDYYSNLYPSIEADGDIIITDDRNTTNQFIVEEFYHIEKFWSEYDENTIYSEVYPLVLESMINYQNSAKRSMPYYLGEPIIFKQKINLELPVNWNFTNYENKISGDGFVYEKSIIGKGKKLEAKHNYELNKSYISSDSAEKFLKQHEDIQQQLTYQLTYTPTSTTTAKYSWVSIFLVLITLGFSFGLGRRIYKNYNPKPIKNAENLNIGGWMVLPAIGLVISPFLVAYQVFTNNYFDQVSWDVIRASGDYNSANFAILYGGELVYNVLVFSFAIFLAVLFFQRRSSLPFLISIYYAFVLVGLLVDTIALQMVAPDLLSSDDILASIKELSKTFIAAAIWIPYFNISTRVKNTFCKTLNENGKLIEPTVEAIEE